MDYLTNYYKNLSEQLQYRIYNLEKLIESSNKTPTYARSNPISPVPGTLQEPGTISSRPESFGMPSIQPNKPGSLYVYDSESEYGVQKDPTGEKAREALEKRKEALQYQDSPEWQEAIAMPMMLPNGQPNMMRVRAMEKVRNALKSGEMARIEKKAT
jgi:hypothetical protein